MMNAIDEKENIYTWDQYPPVLTARDVAKILQIGMNQTYILCAQPDFPAVRIGKKIRISRERLRRWVDDN